MFYKVFSIKTEAQILVAFILEVFSYFSYGKNAKITVMKKKIFDDLKKK